MTKRLVKHGNSYALIFDQTMMQLIGMTPDVELDIRTDGRSYLVTPIGVEAGVDVVARAAEVRKKAARG